MLYGVCSYVYFYFVDGVLLNCEYWMLVLVLVVVLVVDVMKLVMLGFVMFGMMCEYVISKESGVFLVLVVFIGIMVGLVLWGCIVDVLGWWVVILLLVLMFMGMVICGVMFLFGWNLVMCFLMGVLVGGLLLIIFILMVEVVFVVYCGWLLVVLGGIGILVGYLLVVGVVVLLELFFSWCVLWLLGLFIGVLIVLFNCWIFELLCFLFSVGMEDVVCVVLWCFVGIGV